MFRKMRRFKQQLDERECIEILKSEPRGVLSVIGDDGYPYGMPVNQWYCEENGKIYFHGAKAGHKIDSVMKCDKVSFCVYDKGFRKEGEWAVNFRSVIVFGKISPVTDQELTLKICRSICGKFTDDEEYIEDEIKRSGSAVLCLELTPEHITGKSVKES